MELNQFAQNSPTLRHLLQQSQYFLMLDKRVKSLLPPNLHAHFKVACLQQGELVLLAKSSMAASRLKMMVPAILAQIQSIDEQIMQVKINVLPENPTPPKEKHFHIPDSVLPHFEQTAEKLSHAPELAQALLDLVAHHRQEQA